MNIIARWSALISLLAFVALTGCSNPAADVTAAKVGDAEPIPAEAEVTTTETETEVEVEGEAAPAAAEEVAFDGSSSKIDFVGSKLVGSSHDGGFKSFTGRFLLPPDGESISSVSVTIDMNSIWSDNDKLTGHLKNEDFFEVETYPESEFVSTAIVADTSNGGTHEITGNLTLHGVTKSVSFPATVAITDEAVSLDSEFKIDRTIWGIVYGSEADVRDNIINKDVVIRLDVDAARGAEATEAAE
ncbi:YceI family protein [Tautonia marina]|uniref:YceI family protein n=1 Tax=Tautonia marina TaxID=2653855 RepID=UPI001261053A|nr:YceI family protein [Tautonia marina]